MSAARVSYWLIALAVVSLCYAAAITFLNVQHIRAMPPEERSALGSLDDLASSVSVVEIGEADVSPHDGFGSALQRLDVRVLYGDRAFPLSRDVWVNTALSRNDPGRYLNRFRVGRLTGNQQDESLRRSFLIEVHQNFREQGDQPYANLWLFPSPDSLPEAFENSDDVDFAHNISIDKAMAEPSWRAIFAKSHARLVRAFPALAALLIGIAACGSVVLKLWREQPWAVFATTVTFVLPIVSAAPFLTAFGWMPLVAAVVLGFVITVGIACAVEQRALAALRAKITSRLPKLIAEAALVPAVALLVGTTLVVSFASVSVIEWQGLGSASPGEIFVESLIRPAIGLLLGGLGSGLILTVFYVLLRSRKLARLA